MWSQRFGSVIVDEYSCDRVEEELLVLFPVVEVKGLRLNLSYEDSLVDFAEAM